jgi:lipopolysaccharide export LptBFGC system permease protein LptF
MSGANGPRLVPGERLRVLALRLFDRVTAERYLLPAVADLQHEARGGGEVVPWRRLHGRVLGYCAFWRTFVVCAIRRSPGEPGVRTLRLLVPALAALTVVTALLAAGPLATYGRLWLGRLGAWPLVALLGLLVPQALVVALPVSVLFAGFVAFRRLPSDQVDVPTTASLGRSVVLLATAAAVLGLFVMVWWVPPANQAFREHVYRQATGRQDAVLTGPNGPSEMAIRELRQALSQAGLEPRRRIGWDYYLHLKAALPASALAFGFLTIGLARRRQRRPWLRGLGFSILVILLYYVVLSWTRAKALEQATPAWFAAWSPNLVMAALALGVSSVRMLRLAGPLGSPPPPGRDED